MNEQNNIISIKQDAIFTACIQTYDNFYTFPKHMHQNAEMYFVTNGSCSMYIKDEKITLKENDFIIIFPHVLHSLFLENADECKFYHIHFDLEELSSLQIELKDYSFTIENLQLHLLLQKNFLLYRHDLKIKSLIENIVTEHNSNTPYSKIISNLNLIELIIKIISI